jgi:hypothetical protein
MRESNSCVNTNHATSEGSFLTESELDRISCESVLMESPDIRSILAELVQNHINDQHSEREMLLWMLVLHNHRIKFRVPVAQGFPDPTLLHPSTQRLAAEVIAGIWQYERDQQKRDYRYWYHEFVVHYGDKQGIPAAAVIEVEGLRRRLLNDKRVLSVELE